MVVFRKMVFNIVDNYEIIASIILSQIRDSWQIVDFCTKFYNFWEMKEEQLFEAHSYEILSHDLRLRALRCCELCGGYQSVLDCEYMASEFPKLRKEYNDAVWQYNPCIFLNPSLIKVVSTNENAVRVSFSFVDKKFYFFNCFEEYFSISDLNLYLNSPLQETDIIDCPYNMVESSIEANEIKEFNDWIYYDLNGFDLDDISGEDTWVFREKNKKYCKLKN